MLSSISSPKNKLELGRAVASPNVKSFRVYEMTDAAARRDMLRELDSMIRNGNISVILLDSK